MFQDTRLSDARMDRSRLNKAGLAKKTRQLALGALAAMLVACGGGATDGCSNLDPTRSTDLQGCKAAAVTGTATSTGTATGTGTAIRTIVPLSIFPASMTIGDCTTNIPFVFKGGTAPFTIFTSDNIGVPVSAALPIGSGAYFTASIRALGSQAVPVIATLTVLDSQSYTATANITIPVAHASCAANPLLQTSPASANMRVSEILAFQVSGGPIPAPTATQFYSFKFSDAAIATDVKNVGATFHVQALKAGSTLITVTSPDGQNTNITLTVL